MPCLKGLIERRYLTSYPAKYDITGIDLLGRGGPKEAFL